MRIGRRWVFALAVPWIVFGLIAGLSPISEGHSRGDRGGVQLVGWMFVFISVLMIVASLRQPRRPRSPVPSAEQRVRDERRIGARGCQRYACLAASRSLGCWCSPMAGGNTTSA